MVGRKVSVTYLMSHWIHDFADEPILLYSELDDHRYEVRKIELYRNGRVGYASAEGGHGGAGLSLEPIPTMMDILRNSEFMAAEVSRGDFERRYGTFSCQSPIAETKRIRNISHPRTPQGLMHSRPPKADY